MVSYALCMMHGEGIAENKDEAIVWAVKALSTGDSYAAGFCAEFGLAQPQDESAAIRLYEKSALGGFSAAQYRLGLLLTEDPSNTLRMASGRQYLLEAAKHGQGLALCELGNILAEEHSDELAAMWLRRAVAQGLVDALCGLSSLRFETTVVGLRSCSVGSRLLCEAVRRAHPRKALTILEALNNRLILATGDVLLQDGKQERAAELYQYGRLFVRGLPAQYQQEQIINYWAALPSSEAVTLYSSSRSRAVQACCILLGMRKMRRGLWALLPRDLAHMLCRILLDATEECPQVWGAAELLPRRSDRLKKKRNTGQP
jgi:TPR repeat protein